MEPVNVRNLDDIQEEERGMRGGRLLSLFLATLAGAAVVTAGVVMSRRGGTATKDTRDPLAELVAQAKGSAPTPEKLASRDVSFPGILSDEASPTTALAAVKDERGRLVTHEGGAAEPPAPPPATDRLPVVPLPVGDLLSATPVTTVPKDELTAMAVGASRVPGDAGLAAPGTEGGFQLQVASFKDQRDADRLVEDLRRRGHRAYRQAANVPEKGLWHRVRIGPFKTKFEAAKYKTEFERSERVSPFVVDPDKVKQAADIRAMRLQARERKDNLKKQRAAGRE